MTRQGLTRRVQGRCGVVDRGLRTTEMEIGGLELVRDEIRVGVRGVCVGGGIGFDGRLEVIRSLVWL